MRTILIGLVLIGTAGFIGFQANKDYQLSQRCSASTPAELDTHYTEIKSGKFHQNKSYEVKYSFVVNGKTYTGKETLKKEPTDVETTMHYNPTNPSEHLLELKAAPNYAILGGMGLLGLGVAGFGIWSRKKNAGNSSDENSAEA